MKKIFMATMVAAMALMTSCNNGAPKANLKTDIDTLSYELGMVMSPGEQVAGYLTQAGSDSAYVDEYLKGFTEGVQAGDDKKKMAYYMGVMQGLQSKMQMAQVEQQVFQGDSTKKVSIKNFVSGYAALVKNKTALRDENDSLIDKQAANQAIMDYMFGKHKKESTKFMADIKKQAGVKALPNDIYYKEITPSTSTEHATDTSTVVVKYEGKLTDGSVFDSSASQKDGIVTFNLKNVIKGWQVAIPKMPVGATWDIYVPYQMAYGERGTGPIPPYSALVFRITLVSVK